MGTNRKPITVDFTRSIAKKIDVRIIREWAEYVEESNFKIHNYPSGGAVRTDLVVTVAVTAVLLLIIATAIILTLNG